jgi:hypothetical protein
VPPVRQETGRKPACAKWLIIYALWGGFKPAILLSSIHTSNLGSVRGGVSGRKKLMAKRIEIVLIAVMTTSGSMLSGPETPTFTD